MKRLILITSLSIVGLLVLVGVTVQITSQPAFCNSCHYMEPFYASWDASAHRDVSCTKCHFEPGLTGTIKGKFNGLYQLTKYVSLAYKKSKPWAEITDASCMRDGCHQTQMLLGPIQFKNVTFDHSHHLGELRRGKRLRCTSCHSQIVQGQHILVTEETCFLCHLKDREIKTNLNNCQTCHTDEIFLEQGSQLRYNHTTVVQSDKACETCHVNTIEGNASVSIQQCINCHWQTDFFERFDDPEFLHQKHVTDHKVECIACHTPITHRIRRKHLLTGEDCQSCHPDMHLSQAQLFAGLGGYDLPPAPNPMYEAGLACQSCHIFHQESLTGDDTMIAKAEACDKCHGQGYGDLLEKWGQHLVYRQSDVASYVEEAHTILGSSGRQAPEALDHAKANLQLVMSAKGIHNIRQSDNLLAEAYRLISQALVEAGEEDALRTYVPSDQLIPFDCANCHFGIEETSIEVYDLDFRHDRHLTNGVTCAKCHSNLEVHGELLLSRDKCLTCHHGQEERACSTCHVEQDQLLTGETPFFSGDPDFMWAEDVTCQDCHLVEVGVVRKSAELCADCHDEDYPDMVTDWREQIEALLGSLPADRFGETVDWLTAEGSLGGHNPQSVIDYLDELVQLLPHP